MSIDKGLYAAPQGIMEGQPDMEIQIEDPESVKIKTDGLEVELEPRQETDEDFEANLAEYMPENEMTLLAGELIDAYEEDLSSRKDWIQTYVDGLD